MSSNPPVRRLGDGHLSPLDFSAIKDNLRDQLSGLTSGVNDAQRSQDSTPPGRTITHPMLFEGYEETGALQDSKSLDSLRLVSAHDLTIRAGHEAVGSTAATDMYFTASYADDNQSLSLIFAYGFRYVTPQDVDIIIRCQGEDSPGAISITYLGGAETESIIFNTGGDTWVEVVDTTEDKGSHAQSVTIATAGILSAVKLYLKKAAGSDSTLQLYVYNNAGGVPGQVIAVSNEVQTTTLSTTGDWVEFALNTQSPLPGLAVGDVLHFALAISIIVAGNVYWYQDTAGGYASGNASHLDAGAWVADASKDNYISLLHYGEQTDDFHACHNDWEEFRLNVASILFNHSYLSANNLADFYLTLPARAYINSVCMYGNSNGGQIHWRAGHVRTPFIPIIRSGAATVGQVLGADGAGGVAWGGYAFTPGFFDSDAWNGDAKAFDSSGIIDLSAEFGLPAGIKGIQCRFSIKDETVNVVAALSSTSGSSLNGIAVRTQVANQTIDVAGFVPCDANGDIYFGHNGELDAVTIYITGHYT